MGSMKRKRRKKLANAWKVFQAEHELSDAEAKLARSIGYPVDRLVEKLSTGAFGKLPIGQAISLLHGQHEQMLAQRRAENAEGSKKEDNVKKKKGFKHDPAWVKAKRLCRLNQDEIRKAKELGLNPMSLMKNIPSPNQQWKLPVKEWINELYETRIAKKAARAKKRKMEFDRQQNDSQIQPNYTSAFDAYLAGDFAALHAFESERNRAYGMR